MADSLGKGTVYFMLVQVIFLASGYVVHAGLGRILGPKLYGTFGVVIALVTVFNFLLTSGFPQAVSRYIAMRNESAAAVKKAAEKVVLPAALAVFILYFLFAGAIASLLGDTGLTLYIRISAFIIPAYAIFSLYTGFLNGLREYGKQAKSMLFYNVAKVAGVFALVLLGFSVSGALAGFALAPVVGFLVARYYFRPPGDGGNFQASLLVRFAVPVVVYYVALQVLISLDLFFVKRIIAGEAVGYYTAAANLAKIPYIVLSALGAALFPAIAGVSHDAVQTRKYVKESMRYLLMLLLPGVAMLSATSQQLVTLLYSSRYLAAAEPMSILVAGLGFFTLFAILTTVITASGRAKAAMVLAVAILPIAFAANALLIPMLGLKGAAIATSLTGMAGFFLAFAYMRSLGIAVFAPLSVAKIALGALLTYAIALKLPQAPLLLPIEYAGIFGIYLLFLLAVREFGREDAEVLGRIIARGG